MKKTINFLSTVVIVAILGLYICFHSLLIRIEVGDVGVRTKQYAVFGSKGVEKRDFGPGFHRNFPLVDTWNIFDATVQTTEFTTAAIRKQNVQLLNIFRRRGTLSTGYAENVPSTGPGQIELKSKDGYTVKLDVTVKYRIVPGKVHELYQKFNTELRYEGIVRDQVQNTMRNIFGTMITEEFYDARVRRSKTDETSEALSKDLADNNVELIDILIRDIAFDPTYERKILDKKLADQDVELNKSLAVSEEKKGLTNKISAETEAKVRVIDEEKNGQLLRMKAETDRQVAQITADARLKVARLAADADLYAAQKTAEGSLMEREAEAEGERLKAVALGGSGGANLVALEAARQIKLDRAVVSTLDVDFLDLESMIEKLGAHP